MIKTVKTFKTRGKATIWVSFKSNPQVFTVYNSSGKVDFFRILNGKYSTIKFNVLKADIYRVFDDLTDCIVKPLSIHPLCFTMPPHQREDIKPYKIVKNFSLGINDTPARNFVAKGIIEVGQKFFTFPAAIQHFIILHEEGHFFYKDEELADLYAAKKYIAQGYNNSMAYYALTKVLHPNNFNSERIDNLFKHLHR